MQFMNKSGGYIFHIIRDRIDFYLGNISCAVKTCIVEIIISEISRPAQRDRGVSRPYGEMTIGDFFIFNYFCLIQTNSRKNPLFNCHSTFGASTDL